MTPRPIFNNAFNDTFIINTLQGYKRASGTTNRLKPEILGDSDDHLADAPGSGIDAQGIVRGRCYSLSLHHNYPPVTLLRLA